MDSDMQNDPADIPRLLDKLEEGYDCVSGWRKDRKDSVSKTIPSKIQTYLAWTAGPKIHDFGCTLKAYRRKAINDIGIYGEGHRYIPSYLYQRGYTVTEIPVNHRPRNAGKTKYGAKRLLKGSLDLFFNAFWNRFSTRPLHFLGGIGFLSMAIGAILGIHAVLIKYLYGASLNVRTPRLILISLLIIFGIQLVLFGFLAEMVTKYHYRDENPYRVLQIIE
jgi:glycosyltransferase involved in cell wall biosynthesis